jgi:hypothetical protein
MKRLFHTYIVLLVASISFGFLFSYGCGGETADTTDTTEGTDVTDGDTTDQNGVDQGIDFNVDKVEIVLLDGTVIDAETVRPFPPVIKSVRITVSLVDGAAASVSKQAGEEELKALADELVTILYDGVEVGFTSSWFSETVLDFVLETPAEHGSENMIVVKEKDGENVKKEVAFATSTYHDVNGDGVSDMLFGAWGIGKAYLVYGGSALREIGQNVAVEDYADKVKFSGQEINWFGHSRALVDFDADGFFDVIVAAPFASFINGQVDLFYGSSSMPTPLEAGSAIKIIGEDSGMIGRALITGDVNNDGLEDLLIGAPGIGGGEEQTGENENGNVYIFFAGEDPIPGPVSNADIVIKGKETDMYENYFGLSMATGDINGDGLTDILVGGRSEPNGNVGEVYVFLGPIMEDIDLSEEGVDPDLTIRGRIPFKPNESLFGLSISVVGDLNEDGVNDFVVGDPKGYDESDQLKGAVYIFDGSEVIGDPTPQEAADYASTVFYGTSGVEYFGMAITPMSGFDDAGSVGFAFSAPYYDAGSGYEGKVEVKTVPTLETLEQFIGETATAGIGGSLESQKDVDGDGYNDLLIGAENWGLDPPTINENGKVYIYFGPGSDPFEQHVSFIGPEDANLLLDKVNLSLGVPQ